MTNLTLKKQFKRFFPVVVDVETTGCNAKEHALLELSAITLKYNTDGILTLDKTFHEHILPFKGAVFDPKAMAFHEIIPDHPFRYALEEQAATEKLNGWLKTHMSEQGYRRAILVGHNAHFDLGFLVEAYHRSRITDMAFHHFSVLDTASLSALCLKETVLARSLVKAKIDYDPKQAHGALYDATVTAKLFCHLVNHTFYKP
jgi:ribonuclease T